MTLAANQVLFNGNGIDYTAFSTTGAYGQARGDNAPLQSFGLRVFQSEMMGQSNNVRIGLELDDAESDTLIQLLIDQATLTVDAAGVMSITVPDAAQAHVVVRNAASESATVSTSELAADVVSFTAIPDDPTSFGLTVNIDAIMAAAIAAAPEAQQALLQSMRDVEGRFDMRMAVSGIELFTSSGTQLALTTPLTVGDQPPISGGSNADPTVRDGSGVAGVFYIGDGNVPPGAGE